MMKTAKVILQALLVAGAAWVGIAQVASAQTTAATPNEYRLGPGDVVRVSVYQNPDLTLETRISESGVASYPLLGTVRLGGNTVSQAEKLIADGLRNGNFVKQPQVSVMLLQVRGSQASVLGQVNRPGRYPIEALAGAAAVSGKSP